MSTLAQILSDLGNEVSGYDDAKDFKFTQVGLEKRNIPIYYDQNHKLDQGMIVTYSVAFNENHKELLRAKENGLVIKKYNEIVGEITKMFNTICVSGTHGKTTTTSIIRCILESTLGCNYFIGSGDGKVTKDNKYFVIESDEFNRHFLSYHPKYAIITNIEAEHLECYHDIDDIRCTFEEFVNKATDFVIACGDNLQARKINYKTKVYFYGFNDNNDIVIKKLKLETTGSNFDLYFENKFYGSFYIPLYGKHMVLNATAAIILCRKLGINETSISKALENFKNAERRFAVEKVNETIIIDDYAHHPTEIKVTLEAIKQKYPNKKLTVIFKPNTYSRTKDFANEFGIALGIADKVFLTEIDSNREKQEDYPEVNSKLITSKIKDSEIIDENNLEIIKEYKDSVICVMSCADVSHILEKLREIL